MKDDNAMDQDKNNKKDAYDKELDKVTQPMLPLLQPDVQVVYPVELGFPPPPSVRPKRPTLLYGLPTAEEAPEQQKVTPPPGRKHGKET